MLDPVATHYVYLLGYKRMEAWYKKGRFPLFLRGITNVAPPDRFILFPGTSNECVSEVILDVIELYFFIFFYRRIFRDAFHWGPSCVFEHMGAMPILRFQVRDHVLLPG